MFYLYQYLRIGMLILGGKKHIQIHPKSMHLHWQWSFLSDFSYDISNSSIRKHGCFWLDQILPKHLSCTFIWRTMHLLTVLYCIGYYLYLIIILELHQIYFIQYVFTQNTHIKYINNKKRDSPNWTYIQHINCFRTVTGCYQTTGNSFLDANISFYLHRFFAGSSPVELWVITK